MQPDEEAKAILNLTGQDFNASVRLVQDQFNVIYTRAQSLVGLAGIVVTVTGFSGRIIAATDRAAQIFIIAGLATVLLSAWWVFVRVMRIRWLTTMLTDEKPACLASMITGRNRKTRAISHGGTLLFVGLALYFIAITIMLWNPEPLQIPAR